MATSAIESRIELTDDGVFLLSGELSFASVPGLLREGRQRLIKRGASDATITVDLQGVSRTDSAGLALLVEWTRDARRQGGEIAFLNIPAQMAALARLSGLEGVLSLSLTQA